MRRVIYELLEPCVNRGHEDRDQVNQIERQLDHANKRINELEVAVF